MYDANINANKEMRVLLLSEVQMMISIFSNLFYTYVIYRFMHLFFQHRRTSRCVEGLSYALYYLVETFVYLFFGKPYLQLLVNMVSYFLLTFLYPSTIQKKLCAPAFIIALMLSSESIVLLLLRSIHYISDDYSDLQYIVIQILIQVTNYLLVLIASQFHIWKRELSVPAAQWFGAVLIPFLTLIPIAIMAIYRPESDPVFFSVITSILFFVNILVLYLYDQIMQSYQNKLDKKLLLQQNNAYLKQLELIQHSQENIRLLKHDFKHHLATLHNYLKTEDITSAMAYLQDIDQTISGCNVYVACANETVNAILNAKIHLARQYKITVQTSIHLPEQLRVRPFDLSAILGNLMDNAIEATKEITDAGKKNIFLEIKMDRDIIFLTMQNPFCHQIQSKNGSLCSTHTDRANHGYGLRSIEAILKKYNGTMDYAYQNNQFRIKMLFYNQEE